MPLIVDIHTSDDAHLMVWKDEEDLGYFLNKTVISDQEMILLERFSVERRKKDLIIARYLLQQKIPTAKVTYHKSGKPYLENQEAKISISHSKDLVSVMIHPTRTVGIDIEYISPRVERIQQRFLSSKELSIANTTRLKTLYWSAKETLFKLDDKQGLEFNTEISLLPKDNQTLIGKIRQGNDINIQYIDNHEWVLTYAIL